MADVGGALSLLLVCWRGERKFCEVYGVLSWLVPSNARAEPQLLQ
jgi:hypothetical protein